MFQYYLLDWIAMGCLIKGIHLIQHKNKFGFILSGLGCVLSIVVSTMAKTYGFVVMDTILAVMYARGFLLWRR